MSETENCIHDYECIGSTYHHSENLVSVGYECKNCGETFEEEEFE